MVRALRLFVFVLAALSVLSVAVPTRAQTTPAECQATIADLRAATEGATFLGRNAEKDEQSLVARLDSAAAKLAQGKIEDAIRALTAFRGKVETLQTQGKIVSGDAQTLLAGADAAIACVQQPASA